MLGPKKILVETFSCIPNSKWGHAISNTSASVLVVQHCHSGKETYYQFGTQTHPKAVQTGWHQLGYHICIDWMQTWFGLASVFFLLWPHYWKCAAICWRCNAARIPRPGFRKKTSPSLINTLLDTWDLLCYKLLVISIAHKLNYHPIPPPYLKHLGLLSGPNLVEIPTKPSNHPSVYNHIWWWDQFHEMGECLVYIISAVPLARFGPLFTDFNMVWQLRTTSEWIRDCLPHPPNPLIYVQGFDVSMLTLCWH